MSNYLLFFGVTDINVLPQKVLIQLNDWLSHSEEREDLRRDIWGNWEHCFSRLNYQQPFADQLVLDNISYKPKSIWPKGKKFAVCITHDVDTMTSNANPVIAQRWSIRKRKELGPYIFLKSYLKATYQRVTKKIEHDILWMNETWIDFELTNNVKSTIFFMVKPSIKNLSKYDNDYTFKDKFRYRGNMITIKDYCKQLFSQGFEIGLHGSFLTCKDITLFLNQKKKIEAVIKTPILSTRQHYLHYEINHTPEIHASAKISVDSTLGYNKTIGFRSGTCFPYLLSNQKGETLNVLEIPQILMDGAIFQKNSLSLNKKEGLKTALDYMEKVENVGGCFTINFHPEHFIRKEYFSLFKEIILEAKKQNAYFGTLSEIENIVKNIN